eukprot:8582-Eustigmatos_ZCMA.PRE.1
MLDTDDGHSHLAHPLPLILPRLGLWWPEVQLLNHAVRDTPQDTHRVVVMADLHAHVGERVTLSPLL